MTETVVHSAYASPEKAHRRSITLIGEDGMQTVLTACEQRKFVPCLR